VIVLDTNVLSGLMEPEDSRVVAWLDEQEPESIWTTAVTIFEIRFGIALLSPERRQRQLGDAFAKVLDEDLQGRILPFDHEAATEAANRAAERRTIGKPLDFRDIEIAGIVSARRATLATRNVRHFQDLGIELIDPWARSS
jgi:predicted nucleic acid-binding protein